jgi:O-6-methylguanine DNA methyltransferase
MKTPRVEIAVDSVATAAGRIWILCSQRGLREVRLGDGEAPTAGEGRRRAVSFVKRPRWTDPARRALERFFAARTPLDDVVLDVEAGTEFQQRVWQAARRIPLGQVRSYGDVARMIAAPGATRAVGNALNVNPVSVVVPCHRVIHADAGLGAFAAGLRWKRFLLEHERGQLELGMGSPKRSRRS